MQTLAHKRADRVPNFELIIGKRNVNAILGYEANKKENQLSPEEYVELAARIGMDTVNVRLRWKLGWVDERTDHYVGGNIKGWDDLQGIKPPDLRPVFDKVDALAEMAATAQIGVCFVLGGPISTAYLAMGLIDFMLALYDRPAFVNALMDVATDFCCAVVEEACRHNIAFLILADDMGMDSGLMISPTMLQELWVPCVRQILRPAKMKGVPLVLHSDGDIHDILPVVAKEGFDGVHPLQPTGKLDIYRVKKEFGNRLCLFGNIDVAGVLSFGTPEEVAEDVKEHILRLKDDGGYVCASSHAILDSVPPENFEAMLEAIHCYGKY